MNEKKIPIEIINLLKGELREQKKIVRSASKRIQQIEGGLLKIEVDKLKATGLLSQLAWGNIEYVGRYETYGIRSKETSENSKIVKKIQKWIWKRRKKGRDAVKFFETKNRVVGIFEECVDDYFDEENVRLTIFAIYIKLYLEGPTGEFEIISKQLLNDFAKKWNLIIEGNNND